APPAPAPAPSAAPSGAAEAPAAGPQEFGEEIVVTATRDARARRDATAAVTVISRGEIEQIPAKTADELLRSVPSFATFRQSSSLVADPSSQGMNLRGIGPSGVSRALVLMDGLPVNDPYGGWVYWRGIPRLDIERIEVAPGGSSAIYGNAALGGVTQIITRAPTPSTAEATASYGSFGSYQVGARASDVMGPVGLVVAGDLLQMATGYPVVSDGTRGPVDGNAESWAGTVTARAEAALSPELAVTARGGFFYEDENGGTQYTTAAARRAEYGGTVRWSPESAGTVELQLIGHAVDFKQDRARIAASPPPDAIPRTSETLAERQDVPAHDFGGALLWSRHPGALAAHHAVTIGLDARRTTGAMGSDQFPVVPPGATAPAPTALVRRDASGVQLAYGGFVQDVVDITPRVALQLALRYDGWQNQDGERVDRQQNGTVKTTPYADRTADQLSPKVGVRIRPFDALTLRAAAYRAFRAPTLNELYRPFQVGQVITDSNPNLGPERLQGAEVGFELTPLSAVTTRVTGFWNVLQDPIVNVTTGQNLRQRQNLGEARIRGAEADVEWRVVRNLTAAVGYTFVDPIVTSAPGQEALVGNQLPLDPRHRATASLLWDDLRRFAAMVQVRYVGPQFEDDQNQTRLGEFALLDVSARWRTTRHLDLVFGVENLLDKTYLVGHPGAVENIGQPRFIHAGVAVRTGT
ncbi:MAG TPA: TonB-dependent receptor, partial [Anaeromyxobacteraceae bacterium]|nr:TonB-dependent receptor [Anaeromyxobacteraceae bacterium]